MKEKKSHDPKNDNRTISEPTGIEEVDVGFEEEEDLESQELTEIHETEAEEPIPEEWKGKPESEITLLREIQDLKKKLEESEKVWFDKYARLQAEFENFQRRNLKEKDNYINYASSQLISKLLTTLDNFEIMLKNLEQKLKPNEFKGIKMIFEEFYKVFEKEGLTPIKAKGEIFDPFVHEILMIDYTDEYPEDMIIEELQRGYKFKDRVIRPSKVRVAKLKKIEEKKLDSEIKEVNKKINDKMEEEKN